MKCPFSCWTVIITQSWLLFYLICRIPLYPRYNSEQIYFIDLFRYSVAMFRLIIAFFLWCSAIVLLHETSIETWIGPLIKIKTWINPRFASFHFRMTHCYYCHCQLHFYSSFCDHFFSNHYICFLTIQISLLSGHDII